MMRIERSGVAKELRTSARNGNSYSESNLPGSDLRLDNSAGGSIT